MNWWLIFGLSLFGLAMAFATVYFIPTKIDPFCWLVIFIICANQIAKYAEDRYFLHGFLVSLVNCVWIAIVHILMAATYFAHHKEEAKQYATLNAQFGLSVTQAMLLREPIVGILSGVVLGLFALIASKFVDPAY
jgi:hypothetical protein